MLLLLLHLPHHLVGQVTPSNLCTAGLKDDKTATFTPPLLLQDLLLLLPGTIAISKPSTTPLSKEVADSLLGHQASLVVMRSLLRVGTFNMNPRISVLDQGNYHTPSMCSRKRPHVFTPRLHVASHCSSTALACGASAKAVYAKLQKPRADRKKLCKVKRFAKARRAKMKGARLSPL